MIAMKIPRHRYIITGFVIIIVSVLLLTAKMRNRYPVISRDEENKTLTLVTAYFDIGSFSKGKNSLVYDNHSYFRWFEQFGHLNNPLVVYTDSKSFAQHAARVRMNLTSCTRIVETSRNKFWAFQLHSKVAEVYTHPDYPKFMPNTVKPDYACAMHAKFAVIHHAILNRYFPSVHYAWIDVGCFRSLEVVPTEALVLVPPSDLNPSCVMYSEVHYANFKLTPSQIYRGNKVWVSGASFVGKSDVIVQFTEQYRRTAELFLYNFTLSNTDQQVIYSMYSKEGRKLVNASSRVTDSEERLVWSCLPLHPQE